MKPDKEYLIQLVLFEISGKIRDEEKTELHRIIASDNGAKRLYNELYADYGTSSDYNWGAGEVWNNIHRKQRKRLTGICISGIAAIAIIFAGIRFMKPVPKIQPAAGNSKHIQLQLSGGQLIDLSQQQGQVAAGGTVLQNNRQQLHFDAAGSGAPEYATLTVPAGKEYTVHLPDGSDIQLNAETRLMFPMTFSGDTRDITIHGEAYLKIARIPEKPFVVHLPGTTVQVIGTEFNVNTYTDKQVKVSLVKGAVKLRADGDSLLLKPGEESVMREGMPPAVDRFDPDDVLAWRQGMHLFHQAGAAEVATLIHRFYDISVQLDKIPPGNKTFTGSINRYRPVAHFLEGLKYARFLDYYFDKDSILHLTPPVAGR